MGGLAKESRELPLACGEVAGGAKAGKRFRSADESFVSVEPPRGAPTVVPVFEKLIEKRPADEAANVIAAATAAATASTSAAPWAGRSALALATSSAVGLGGATPPVLATT